MGVSGGFTGGVPGGVSGGGSPWWGESLVDVQGVVFELLFVLFRFQIVLLWTMWQHLTSFKGRTLWTLQMTTPQVGKNYSGVYRVTVVFILCINIYFLLGKKKFECQ